MVINLEEKVKARALLIAMDAVKTALKSHGVDVSQVDIEDIQRAGERLLAENPKDFMDLARKQIRRMQ